MGSSAGDDSERPSGPSDLQFIDSNPLVWGIAGLRGYAFGQQVAPNGLEFNPLFSLDLNLNVWLWPEQRLYAFVDSCFWGQKGSTGPNSPTHGFFDFTKREFDLDLGLAWNYYGKLEARAFAYSFNNLNRGNSTALPSGYNDGVGLENRWYFLGTYPDLGEPGFDVARASFVSIGYYPTKDMVDADGNLFKPGFFAHVYYAWDLVDEGRCYLYVDSEFIAKQSFTAKLLCADGGIAVRPFLRHPHVEFRLGSGNRYDFQAGEWETGLYGAVQFIF
jgi:hypothetical protein